MTAEDASRQGVKPGDPAVVEVIVRPFKADEWVAEGVERVFESDEDEDEFFDRALAPPEEGMPTRAFTARLYEQWLRLPRAERLAYRRARTRLFQHLAKAGFHPPFQAGLRIHTLQGTDASSLSFGDGDRTVFPSVPNNGRATSTSSCGSSSAHNAEYERAY